MLRPHCVAFFLRCRNPVFISAFANNLHTSQICTSLIKRKETDPISVAVVLCGCGSLDGTEVSEAVSAAIHIYQKDMKPQFYAPDIDICEVVNHFTREMDTECSSRNALVEAARIARPCIKPLCECVACNHGALVLPGGFGVARTLSNFVEKGAECTVIPEIEKLIEEFYCARKPIGCICIASVLAAKVLKGVKITLGKETPKDSWPYSDAIKQVKCMGAKVEMKGVKGVTRCKKYNVFSTPAYMYEHATYSDVHDGIGKLIKMLKKNMCK